MFKTSKEYKELSKLPNLTFKFNSFSDNMIIFESENIELKFITKCDIFYEMKLNDIMNLDNLEYIHYRHYIEYNDTYKTIQEVEYNIINEIKLNKETLIHLGFETVGNNWFHFNDSDNMLYKYTYRLNQSEGKLTVFVKRETHRDIAVLYNIKDLNEFSEGYVYNRLNNFINNN